MDPISLSVADEKKKETPTDEISNAERLKTVVRKKVRGVLSLSTK